MASYFASREPSALRVTPVAAQIDAPALAMAFDVSMGVRKKNVALRDELNQVLQRRKPEIDRILDEYGVPRVPQMSAVAPTTPPAQASARK